jgi:hypothetical protein
MPFVVVVMTAMFMAATAISALAVFVKPAEAFIVIVFATTFVVPVVVVVMAMSVAETMIFVMMFPRGAE